MHQTHKVGSVNFVIESWLKTINDGKIVDTVMVDFRKAFGLVKLDP